DFNNLLTAIIGNTVFLQDQLGGGHARHGELAEIRQSADRAASLIQQLLAFARRQVLALRVLDMGAHVQQTQNVPRRLIEANIEIVVRATASGRVRADPTQLEQVILNLAVNARDAMPNGGLLLIEITDAEIDAEAHPDAVPGRYVQLSVTD